MIKNNDIVGYENIGDFKGAVLEDSLKTFAKKAMIELINLPNKKKITKKAIPSTIDYEADKIIHILIKGKASELNNLFPKQNMIIKPLYLFLDEEVLIYAKLKNLKFKDEEPKKDKISLFIDGLEKKHPEIKRAIVNSYLELYV